MVKDNNLFLGGEITTSAQVDYEAISRKVVKKIGYDNDEIGFNGDTLNFHNYISAQSPDIAQGVNEGLHSLLARYLVIGQKYSYGSLRYLH